MPFLDAKALETDPEGMAFLRSVIGPKSRRKKGAGTRLRATDQAHAQAAPPCRVEGQPDPENKATHPLETA
jgi:hypothetical protein